MTDLRYDTIVIGLGAMGSAAAAHLARRGARVLGLDAHPRGHALGASHGRSRIIREAYHETPQYVPLVQRAYALWRELEAETGMSLLTITGGLNLGFRDGSFVDGAIRSAMLHDLPYELLTAGAIGARWLGFGLPDDMAGVFAPHDGILQPERCVSAHLDAAAAHGAVLAHSQPVLRYAGEGGAVRVTTAEATYLADRLVITGGPWASELLADLRIPLTVRRVVNVHYLSTRPELFTRDRFPIFLLQVPEGDYYGIPSGPGEPLKFGRHDGGEICTPHSIRRDVDETEVAALRAVLDRYMPGASGPVESAITCMYTLTPDENFVIDTHPVHPEIVFGCGFSGHGFKFSSVIGEILADLALTGATPHDIAFLSAGRFAPVLSESR